MALDKNYNLLLNFVIFLFIFIGFFLLLSLLSYSSSDPSFSHIVFTNFDQKVENICGKFGAYISDILLWFLGWTSIFIPFVCFFMIFSIIFYRKGVIDLFKLIFSVSALLLLLIELSALSAMLYPELNVFDKSIGGIFGLIARDVLANLFGNVGGLILIFFLLLLTFFVFMVSTPYLQDILSVKYLPFLKIKKKNKLDYANRIANKRNEIKEVKNKKINKEINTVKKELNIRNSSVSNVYNVPAQLLDESTNTHYKIKDSELKEKGVKLEQTLRDFGVLGKVRRFNPGPVVTLYEFEPAAGVKINKITNLENDIALVMSALSVRIIAPIPGKSVIGIELPNKIMETVAFSELIKTEKFINSNSPLTIALGKSVSGEPFIADLRNMPHLLIAGTTGSGKSVCINSIITSILFKSDPSLVKFIMVDPKMVELMVYDGIPHLAAPVVTDAKTAPNVLKNVVIEMERRYRILAEKQSRNIESYNAESSDKMSYLVVIVDEFADLMLTAGKEVEQAVIRISQMARAVGIHLVLATQRPSVNVITGIIKANMPARLSFRVSSKVDSRTILDQNGAETLLGKGDSLFLPPGTSNPIRIHGCFLSEREVKNIVKYLKTLGEPNYNMDLLETSEKIDESEEEELDEKYYEALEFVKQKGEVSISLIQRHFRIGYNRAARIVELMEKKGIITPSDGTSKPRKVLI
ncbi:MAG: DNA translocase FtsK 4TM domain-containing protein [Deferribacterota bacterium]|nr:DNA translocase FtsK 4TM domain-containing protein [Deferribacterota bacterium]